MRGGGILGLGCLITSAAFVILILVYVFVESVWKGLMVLGLVMLAGVVIAHLNSPKGGGGPH
jgi:hypothetical protein